MSTELFLNTNCRLSKQQQFKIKECFKEKYVRDVSFRYIGKVKNVEGVNYYRVLLTRARVGMIICVPEGNAHKNPNGFWEDSTRLPEYYDGTYKYLKSLGIEEV